MKICILCSKIPPSRCGVGDYTAKLAKALIRTGHEVSVLTGKDQLGRLPEPKIKVFNDVSNWRLSSLLKISSLISAINPDVLIIQWVPFLYGKYGINPFVSLLAFVLRIKKIKILTVVHEPWLPFDSLKHLVLGGIQRALVFLLVLSSTKVTVSISKWTRLFKKIFWFKRDNIFFVPVGSNIDLYETNEEEIKRLKEKLDISESEIILSVFSPAGSGKIIDLISAAWGKVSFESKRSFFIIIGEVSENFKSEILKWPNSDRIRFPGYLEEKQVSYILQITNLLLSPFIDGVSSRRGSVIASLAHGVPVLTTRGHLYDEEIFEKSPVFKTNADLMEYSMVALGLMKHKDELKNKKQEIKKFFEKHFSWEVISSNLF